MQDRETGEGSTGKVTLYKCLNADCFTWSTEWQSAPKGAGRPPESAWGRSSCWCSVGLLTHTDLSYKMMEKMTQQKNLSQRCKCTMCLIYCSGTMSIVCTVMWFAASLEKEERWLVLMDLSSQNVWLGETEPNHRVDKTQCQLFIGLAPNQRKKTLMSKTRHDTNPQRKMSQWFHFSSGPLRDCGGVKWEQFQQHVCVWGCLDTELAECIGECNKL